MSGTIERPGDSRAGEPSRILGLAWLRRRPLAAAWLACLLAFVLLTLLVVSTPTLELDKRLAFDSYDLPDVLGPLNKIEHSAGSTRGFTTLTLLFAGWLALRRRFLEAGIVLAAFLPAAGVVLLKEITHELPPQRFGGIARTGSAFPSGHVAGLTVLSVLAWAFADRLLPWPPLVWLARAGCAIIVLTAGYSRVWAGTHWPTDVIGAYLLAALFLIPALALAARSRPPA
jgi:membrane-associated phospholipid phosphatase